MKIFKDIITGEWNAAAIRWSDAVNIFRAIAAEKRPTSPKTRTMEFSVHRADWDGTVFLGAIWANCQWLRSNIPQYCHISHTELPCQICSKFHSFFSRQFVWSISFEVDRFFVHVEKLRFSVCSLVNRTKLQRYQFRWNVDKFGSSLFVSTIYFELSIELLVAHL